MFFFFLNFLTFLRHGSPEQSLVFIEDREIKNLTGRQKFLGNFFSNGKTAGITEENVVNVITLCHTESDNINRILIKRGQSNNMRHFFGLF